MGDFTAIRTYTYVNGAIILANENNTNENTIYFQFNGSMNGTTGHTHSGSVGDGPKLGASSLDLAANYAWTGTHSHAADLSVISGADFTVYSDAGITPLFNVNGTTGQVLFSAGSAAAPSISFIGATNKGLYNSGVNEVSIATNGVQLVKFSANFVELQAGKSLVIPSTQRVYWNSGITSWTGETSPNVIQTFTNSTLAFTINNTGVIVEAGHNFAIQPTQRAYLGINSWLEESAVGVVDINANGVKRFSVNNPSTLVEVISSHLQLTANFKLSFETTGSNYMILPVANEIALFTNSAERVRFSSNGIDIKTGGLVVPSGSPIALDGNIAGNTNIRESAPNVATIQADGVDQLSVKSDRVSVEDFIEVNNLGAVTAPVFNTGKGPLYGESGVKALGQLDSATGGPIPGTGSFNIDVANCARTAQGVYTVAFLGSPGTADQLMPMAIRYGQNGTGWSATSYNFTTTTVRVEIYNDNGGAGLTDADFIFTLHACNN